MSRKPLSVSMDRSNGPQGLKRGASVSALFGLAFSFGAMGASPALAQSAEPTPPAMEEQSPEASQEQPPSTGPHLGPLEADPEARDFETSLDQVFERLRAAQDPAEIDAMTALIWELWSDSPSDTVDLLFERGIAALDSDEKDLAEELFGAITKLSPDFAEGWNKLATVSYLQGKYTASLAQIAQVLSLEPRHFGALQGLAIIMSELGENEQALEAYEKALEVHPHLDHVKEIIRTLEIEVRGRKI